MAKMKQQSDNSTDGVVEVRATPPDVVLERPAMSDLEMTRLCAEAMGLRVRESSGVLWMAVNSYSPLHDDAQAMALVKKFELTVAWQPSIKHWWVRADGKPEAYAGNINRAICECVAKMQQADHPRIPKPETNE